MKNPKIQGALISILFLALGFLSGGLIPNAQGVRGTPGAVLFMGVVLGLLSALVAAGLILIYRTSRIINFAQASIGAVGGVFTYNLAVAETTQWNFFLAFVAGIIVATAMGAIIELGFVRRFFDSPRLVLTVVTIAFIPAVGFAAGQIQALPIFGDPEERSVLEQTGGEAITLPFSDFHFIIGGLDLNLGFPHLFALVVSVLALMGLAFFFRFTRSGVAVRASAENTERAMLLGINVKGLSTIVWAIAGLLSGIAAILGGTVISFQGLGTGGDAASAASAVLVALAAAVLAKMHSITVATIAAVSITVLRQSMDYKLREDVVLFDVILLVVILVGLFLQRRTIQRGEDEASSWKASEEFRPIPKEMSAFTGIRVWRIVLIAIAVGSVLLFPLAATPAQTSLAGFLALVGIVMLSLVILTGWAGQMSLGQFALAGVGALLGGAMTARWGISFWLAIPLTVLATALLAVLIGLPALRVKGLFLAVVTFAFAFAVQTTLFEPKYFGWLIPGTIDRPTLFLLDFEDEKSMYFLAVFAFMLCTFVVTLLRKSRPGRILIALRENEPNIQSFGVNVIRTRLAAFAFAGGLCGFAGILIAHHQRAVAGTTFPAVESLNVFIFTVIGGIGSVAGAVLGALYYSLYTLYSANPLLSLVIGPVGLLLLLYIAPGGLSSILFGARDGILRIIAQRRRMVVPSLFADVDPEAAERKLAPLADPFPHIGLPVLPVSQRYRTLSMLYQNRGRLGSSARTKRRVDAAVLGAAAERAEEIGAAAEIDAGARATGEGAKVAAKISSGPTGGEGEE